MILQISVCEVKKFSPRTAVLTHGLIARSHSPLSGIPYIGGGTEGLIEQSSET